MSSSRQILKKATKVARQPVSKGPVEKRLKDESSDEDSGDEEFLTDEGSDPEDDDDDDDEDSEEDDVSEEALLRLRELLADVDPAELGMLEQMSGSGSEEEGSEAEGDETMEGAEEDDEEDMSELEFEDLEEEDGDVVPVERTTVNDKVALERVLATFKTKTAFFDTLTLTYPKELAIPDAENDLERELEFYKQSLWAAGHAESLFEAASLPFTRPNDYFAEMLKTDAHMTLIRQKLLDESAGIKASEDARKLRDAKKFGKKVQVERLKEREKDKKDVGKRLESLKKKRKNGDGGFASTEDFDIALEDAIAGGPAKKRKVVESERGGRGGARGARGISRRGRDSKFGNPTTSRRPKENNDKLDGDGSSGRGRGGGRGGNLALAVLATTSSIALPTQSSPNAAAVDAIQQAVSQFAPLISTDVLQTLLEALKLNLTGAGGSSSSGVAGPSTPFGLALAASKLAANNANAAVLNDLQNCVNGVQALGGLPAGSACVDAGGNSASAYGTAFDTMLEQFGGILPPQTMSQIQDKTTPFFHSLGLIPPANDLNRRLNDAMASTTASIAGNSVTAVESLQYCFNHAISGPSLNVNMGCINGPTSAFTSLNTIFAGVVEQWVGYLPANAVVDIIHIYTYYFSMTGYAPGIALVKAMNPSIESIGASAAGSTQNTIIQLQQCFTNLIMAPDPTTVTCAAGPSGPAANLQVLVNSVLQQAFGVLPPTIVLSLQKNLGPSLAGPSPAVIATVFQQTFKASGLGPAFVTCVQALEGCVNSAVASGASECAALADKCKPLASA
ncbi:hypothetical protein RQP46_004962 [Phenoliferia psychrophenolica]